MPGIYGPIGSDGYPRPLWDRRTGKIDREVASYMRDNGYDPRHYAEKNWASLSPKLWGKPHFIAGDMDSFYLNLAVYLFEEFTKKATNPKSDATFDFADMLREMAEQIKRNTPTGDSRAGSEH